MKKLIASKFMEVWVSGKFSLWKASLIVSFFIITSPYSNLFGHKFSIEGRLKNPDRKLEIYINNGLFTFVTTIADGSIRKNSGIVGYTNKHLYFLTLKTQYLYIKPNSKLLKRDLFNVNNRYFSVKATKISNKVIILTYDEEIKSDGIENNNADIKGDLRWLQ
ncbi:hypothetical protein [Vibrio hyugaensis]|uniref:hypothetical protein n=1 Tax=Vibrio hyugaensis TaxID=1534743 RepID=UPI001FD49E84|nr:hypothetical protein [Vibrio hyugaensis]